MQSKVFIFALTLCFSGTAMLLGATKGSTGGLRQSLTSTTYATFTVRPAVRLSDGPDPSMEGAQLEDILAPSSDGNNTASQSSNTENVIEPFQFRLQAVGSTSAGKTERLDGAGQCIPERIQVVVFLNN